MDNILENISSCSVSFSLIEGHKIAVSECSVLEKSLAYDFLNSATIDKKEIDIHKEYLEQCDRVYFYSRLNVPKSMGGKGIGTKLLKKTLEYMEKENAFLINTVNAYGSLNTQELIDFYAKHSMRVIHSDGLLIYYKAMPQLKAGVEKEKHKFK